MLSLAVLAGQHHTQEKPLTPRERKQLIPQKNIFLKKRIDDMNNSEITREHDVILARKFGWSAIGHHEGWGDHPIEGYSRIPTYLTAPTFESDGIVLEWVQGQDADVQNKWGNSLMAIIWERTKASPNKWILNYKPGDYARALMDEWLKEVKDE